MKILDDYLNLQKEIFNYFGYVEDWVVIPIDDAREYTWVLNVEYNADGEVIGGEVRFAEDREQLDDWEAGEYYSNEIYTQRFLPKWVYRGEDYTMIVVDTHVDGNKFLQIFDNSKEITITETCDSNGFQYGPYETRGDAGHVGSDATGGGEDGSDFETYEKDDGWYWEHIRV